MATRRLSHSVAKEESNSSFGNIPDVIFADGGITQIRAIRRAIDKYGLKINLFGMVKDDKHNTKKLIDENKNEINLSRTTIEFCN